MIKFKQIIKLKDSLYKNALYLIISTAFTSGSGFLFWVIAARIYDPEYVGLASALISVTGLITILSLLGLDITIIRFLDEQKEKGVFVCTCFLLVVISSLICTSLYVTFIDFFTPSLSFIKLKIEIIIIFILFNIISPLVILQMHAVFVAYGKTEYTFAQSVLSFLRVVLLPIFTKLGFLGIFISYSFVFALNIIIGLYYQTVRLLGLEKAIDFRLLKDKNLINYSIANYCSRILEELPRYILPIMIINNLGAKENAYFFIPWQIAMIISSIPKYIFLSYMREKSLREKNEVNANKVIFVTITIMLLLLVAVLILGDLLLQIFGQEYVLNSKIILVVLFISILPYSINLFYATEERIKKKSINVFVLYLGLSSFTIIISVYAINIIGEIGAAYAWLIANIIVCIFTQLYKKYLMSLFGAHA
jgi:O-antigen/teichoic acid export membrane protein